MTKEHDEALKKLQHLNKVLLAIRNVNQLITKEKDRDRLIHGVCGNLIETRGYYGAWIALLDEQGKPYVAADAGLGNEAHSLRTMMNGGVIPYCIETCLASRGVKVVSSPRTTCGTCPLAAKYDNLSAMSVRLEHGGVIFGTLSVSVPFDLAHDASEHSLLLEVADDIAFALHDLEVMRKRQIVEEREKALAEILDIAPNSITIHDTDGKFLYCNQKTLSLHGYGTKDEFMRINLHDLDVPESAALIAERIRLIESKGEARFEVAHYRKDGTTFPLEVYAKKIVWEGKPAMLSIATDITERKRAEEMLKESEARYRALADNGLALIWTSGVDKKCDYFNVPWLAFTGRSLEDELGDGWAQGVHPEDLPRCIDTYVTAFDQRKRFSMIYRLRHHSGEYRWIQDDGTPRYNSKGEFIGYIGHCLDITGRIHAEDALRRNREWLNNAARMAHVGGWAIDLRGNTLEWTEETFRIHELPFGTPPDVAHAIEFYHPEDRPRVAALVQRAIESGEDFDFEARIITEKKNLIWVRAIGHAVLNKGRPLGIQGTVQDITESKHAQMALAAEKERLSVTLQSIGDGVITTDTNGNVVLFNRAAEEITGWTSAEAAGRPLTEVFNIINEITKQPCENPVARVLSTGKTVELANHTALITRDNREIIIADSAAPIKNAQNETIGVVLVFRDMTEKKKLEKAVEISSKLESLGVLAGGIAHDFNNLLGGIYGYIDLARESSNDEKVTQYLSKTIATIERGRALTGQLLTFAKGGAPVQKIAPLFPFIRETALFALSGSKISCAFDVQQDLWNCNYDSNQIGQVIDNIVINAQQAMPLGGTITVSARNITLAEKEHPVLSKGDYVRVSIKDTGIGIPKELLSRIFDPFFTTKSQGHGLGLATCYSIIHRHGGCIDVDSEPGKGSTFHVYLPATKESAADAGKKRTKQHKGSGTFLVMDDEELMREIIGDMLSSFGYTVVCTCDGKEAVDYVAAQHKAGRVLAGMVFDLTVAGGMGGKEAAREIRKLNIEPPIFVASGYADDPVMKNPAEYGFTASIGKPFRRIELIEMLEKHMKSGGI